MSKEIKLAIVTGGGSGLGLAAARKFTANGVRTVIIGRDQQKLNNAAAELGELCIARTCDLADLSSISGAITNIVDEFGAPDILVNNAGINQKKPFLEVTDQEFYNVIQTNLLAMFAMSREVVKYMTEAGSGSVINISSMASQYGIPYVIAYTATKSAIEGMTRAMATELSPKGIRVNCVAPGFIATDMSAKALNNDPERKQKVMSRTPMGVLGEPADIAEAIWYLAGDAAKYVTGTILRVDGGNATGF